MGRFNWGPEGPPQEAHSRVTEPERFLPLVGWTLELLSRLDADYDVTREEGFYLGPRLDHSPPTLPSVRLAPRNGNAAPIAVAFNDLPRIRVRFGLYRLEPFPDCGCDACDEDAEDEFERFRHMVDAVAAGQFRQWFLLLPDGTGQVGREFRSDERRSRGRSRVEAGGVVAYGDRKDRIIECSP